MENSESPIKIPRKFYEEGTELYYIYLATNTWFPTTTGGPCIKRGEVTDWKFILRPEGFCYRFDFDDAWVSQEKVFEDFDDAVECLKELQSEREAYRQRCEDNRIKAAQSLNQETNPSGVTKRRIFPHGFFNNK